MEWNEKDFQNIFNIATGAQRATPPFEWVEDAFKAKTGFAEAYDDFWNIRERLCQRFGMDFTDSDLERFMDSILKLEEDLARRMFRYGIYYAELKGNRGQEEEP